MAIAPQKAERRDRRVARTADDLVVSDHDTNYQIAEEIREDVYRCYPVFTREFSSEQLDLPLPWSTVGVAR